MRTDITAIIVTYNSGRVLASCLDALSSQGISAIVVDNASIDHSILIATDHGAHVIQTGKNLGYGRANNVGAQAATTSYLLIINPDVVVQPDAVATLVMAAENDPAHALFSPKIVEPDGRVFDTRRGPLGPFASGACFLMRRDVFLDIGGFDENIFLFFEDDDLCRRLTDMNMPPVYVEGAVVRHDIGTSTGDNPGKSDTPHIVDVKRQNKGEFIRRYHLAWSRFYIRQKYKKAVFNKKITENRRWVVWLFRFATKYIFAAGMFNSRKMARYSGSLLGAWDMYLGIQRRHPKDF